MDRLHASRNFRPDIEGLRGIAILMVVAFHCGFSIFSGGFIGVDVFFVLSGYLITMLLVAEVQRTSRLDLVRFYARRVRRLLPASALVVLFTLAVGTALLAPNELDFASRAARATAVYMSNIFFAANAADYFAPNVESNPLLHTWTLAVEEQFYLFWPVLILLTLKYLKSTRALLCVLALLAVLSLLLCVWQTANGGVAAFYGLPARAWEFALGGLATLAPMGKLKLSPSIWSILGWLGLMIVVASGCFISSDAGFPGWIALAPVAGTVALLTAGAHQPGRGVAVVLEARPVRYLGAVSYSWYLWHWPFLVFSTALMPNISSLGKAAAAGLALAVAAIAYRFVENPIRFDPRLMKRATLTLGLGAAITIFSLGAATLSQNIARGLAVAPGMKAVTAAANDFARPPLECISLADSQEVKSCAFGDKSSPISIVLFGDSHAMQWFHPLRRIARSHAWRLVTVVKSGCPAAAVAPPDTSSFRQSCATWRARAIRKIIALRPQAVVLASATSYIQGQHHPASRLDVSLDEWRAGNRRTFTALNGLPVLAVRDTPKPHYDVPTCLARAGRHAWYASSRCEMNRTDSENLPAFKAQQAGAAGLPDIFFLDLTSQLCRGKVCPVVRAGTIMYHDDNHLTGTFSESLAPLVEARLLAIIPPRR